MKPVLFDFYSGAGGAGAGYAEVGFEVVGFDLLPQPRYPFRFVQADALDVLDRLLRGERVAGYVLDEIAVFHGSPPCQLHSRLRPRWADRDYPELIEPTRERFVASGKPYVIENVDTAPLLDPLTLCGSMFGLAYGGRQLRRHRRFESNVFIMRQSCQHRGQAIGVYGSPGNRYVVDPRKGRKAGSVEAYRAVMEMPWANWDEIAQAIPPAYTRHIGGYLLAEIEARVAA